MKGIIYIYYWNLQFIKSVIIIKIKVKLPQTHVILVYLGYTM